MNLRSFHEMERNVTHRFDSVITSILELLEIVGGNSVFSEDFEWLIDSGGYLKTKSRGKRVQNIRKIWNLA